MGTSARIPFASTVHPGLRKLGDRVRSPPPGAPVPRPHADVTLVTAESWVEIVQAWGRPEDSCPRGAWSLGIAEEVAARGEESAHRALLVSRFGRDEPVDAAVRGAALIPEIDLLCDRAT